MDLKFRKTALMMGACLAMGGAYAPNAFAASPNQTVQAVQQSKKVTGHVVDADGPIIGASVVEKGNPKNGAITDLDGNFEVNVPKGATLVISYVGYKTREIVVGEQSNINVTLSTDEKSLEDVVVVGYGVQKKKLVTGATVEVKGDDIAKMNTTQALGALQSMSPGVQIMSNSGKPGDTFNVNIRGAGTNGSTTPLYVIDGVAGGDINSINPSDIERIDVLKDAASSAIYGARAANGVILITTKQGKAGKIQISYDGNIGWQNVYKMVKPLTAKEYMIAEDMMRFNQGLQPFDWSQYIDADLLAAYQSGENPGTNWLERLRNKNAITTNHAVNIAGGSDNSTFSIGAGFQDQDGTFGSPAPSNYRRFTFRVNSEHVVLRGKDKREVLKVGENIYYQHAQTKGIQIGNQYSNNISTALRANPLIPVFNSNGDYFSYNDFKASGTSPTGWFSYNQYSSNPEYLLTMTQGANNKSRNMNLNAVGYVEISPWKGFKYRGQIDYKSYASSWKGMTKAYKINDSSDGQQASTSLTQNETLGWNWGTTHTFNYVFDVSKHHFDALFGMEYSREGNNMGDYMQATATGFMFDPNGLDYAYLRNFTDRSKATVDGTPASNDHSLMSYFGRINYNWNETYMLTAILRADGSSNFAKGHRWGWFPSFSAGWVVTNEKFMEKTRSWLDYLKLRTSWGQNGNENIGQFMYTGTFAFGSDGLYSFNNDKESGTQGGYPSRLPNPDITWETSEQFDAGFDARFLRQRLNLTFDYYVKTTKDLLLSVPIPPENGFSSNFQNAGTVENKGIEIALSWRDRIGSDFDYNVGWNLAYNHNEVTKVNNGNHYIKGSPNILSQGTGAISRMEEGEPIGYFYGYKTEGVMQNAADVQAYLDKNCGGKAENSVQGPSIKPGDLKFVDTNGDGVVNDDDMTKIGDPHPDVTMGLNLGFNWKGLDFSATLYSALGQQVAKSYRRFGDGYVDNFTQREFYSYWNGEGTSNGLPILTAGNYGSNFINLSDIYIKDASYLRMQNITVGYDFTKIWKNSPFQQLRLYFSAQNLFTITGYDGMDPENGLALDSAYPWQIGIDVGNFPVPRTYMIGVNVKF
ncbi:TonB-dependent receptor [uncultured Prevotella sp.]|uniref:SusC/RagA family TonB-linked outer membrane protein n=1 Tax=uncultured Prevotella sp. TaxID=159272 RepID=UPI002584EF84|nr:TonB-dependent receptor [uncultured Prevotella sp.]